MTDRPRRSLGERLRRERESRHWTQEYLAEQIGASVPSINRWENDRVTTPRAGMLNALIKLFGKPVEAWGEGRQVLWNLPFLRNLYFTGRERILAQLHQALTGYNIVAVTQTRVISGLGGIGKTQTAVEYAYRFAQEYDAVLWVRADSREALVSNMAALAGILGLPVQDEADQPRLAKAVKRWLETQDQQTWLLIFDNADDLSLVIEFLPTRGNGAILLTTRSHVVGKHMRRIELDKLTLEEGVPFLLRRAAGLEKLALEDVPAHERQAAEQLYELMDGLPLALDQAAAYIQEHQCSLAEYISLYHQQRPALLRLRNSIDQHDYPDSVATTWLLSFQRIEQAHPAAAELLRLCAFLHPDAIPEEVLLQRVAELNPHVQAEKQSSLLKEIIVIWLRYSLVQHNALMRTLTIHRLVQAVLQDTLEESQQRAWAERIIHVVDNTFPGASSEFSTWLQCQRCLPHALVCAALIERWNVQSEEAAQLLQHTGTYLRERGEYGEAELLLQHALHIHENIVGPEHLSLADYFEALAELYQKQAQYARGELLRRRALSLYERRLEPEHPSIAKSLNNLGRIFHRQGNYSEAEVFYQRALSLSEKTLGPEHPSVFSILNNLGALYSELGQDSEAEAMLQRALCIGEQQLGSEHPHMAYPLTGLAALYAEQGQYAQAEPLYQRALAIFEQALGPDHPNVAQALMGLASLYSVQGRYAQAEPLFLQALRILEQALGGEHPDVAQALNGLANLYLAQGKYEQAEPLYQHAISIRRSQRGNQHPETAESLHDFARFYELRNQPQQALALYREALTIREQQLGLKHLHTRATCICVVRLLRQSGRTEEADKLEDELEEARNREGLL